MSDAVKTSILAVGVSGGAFGDDYRADPALRARAEADPHGVLAERGMEIPPAVDVHIVANTDEVFHVVLPADPNTVLADETLEGVAGGAAACAGCASTASTLGTAISCIGTGGSIGTASTTGNP